VSGFDLDTYLARERAAVDAALHRVSAGLSRDGAVGEAMQYAVEGGGKRLRPVLCSAAYQAVGGDPPVALYDLAASIELVHAYSLVHDDLPSMDDDDVRRGRPATHVVHGVAAATLAGAALIPLAVRMSNSAAHALGVDPSRRLALIRALVEAAGGGGMVGGQVMDLEAEGRVLDLSTLEAIHRRKTGALLGAAPVMGAMAAGAPELALDALRIYGAALGLAFQITDDILDVTATTAVLGKTAGRDTALEKATFAGVAGVDAARHRARCEVEVALAALDAGGVQSVELVALAQYAIERDR
jgi:geranylgeranyl diphosphate synthase, type II